MMRSCTVSRVVSSSSRSFGGASLATSMRRRTSAPSSKSASPRRYLPVSLFCSRKREPVSVAARRCTVLFASFSRCERTVMPSSSSSPEKELSSRMEFATDDSRAFATTRLLRPCSINGQTSCEEIGSEDHRDRAHAQQRSETDIGADEDEGEAKQADREAHVARRTFGAAHEMANPPAVQPVGERHAEREDDAEQRGVDPPRRSGAGRGKEQRVADGVEGKREGRADGGDDERVTRPLQAFGPAPAAQPDEPPLSAEEALQVGESQQGEKARRDAGPERLEPLRGLPPAPGKGGGDADQRHHAALAQREQHAATA